jgi:UDP:flavonoid glycosyltransferase YjiC (YdhE family)
MHAVLVSIGTDGDIFPYVGLGLGLRARGHRVTLAASEHYEPLALRHGFDFEALVSTKENCELFEHPDFWNPVKTAPLSARWGVRFLRRQYEMLSKHAGPGTVLVANPGVFAAGLVHEKHGVPWASLLLQPGLIPSSIAPPAMPCFGFLSGAPQLVWKIFWRGLDALGDVLVGRELGEIRRSLGLRPMRRIFQNWLSRQLVVGLFPDWYGPPQADWPPQIRLAGFPVFDGGQQLPLPPDVLEFCRAGKPPVVFTFGTGMAHSAGLFRAALEACELLGERGVFLTKYPDQLPNPLPPGVLSCRFVPFQKLFPHCAAVVHHGGIGTVAQAMAAGVPQLIRPLCFDQMDNGKRVKQLGVGDYVRSRNGAGREIAAALTAVMTDQVRNRCRAVATRFDGAEAFGRAVEWIETLAGGTLNIASPRVSGKA